MATRGGSGIVPPRVHMSYLSEWSNASLPGQCRLTTMASKNATKDTMLTHSNGATIIVEVMANGVSWAHDSREDEARWIGGPTDAANFVAMYRHHGWK